MKMVEVKEPRYYISQSPGNGIEIRRMENFPHTHTKPEFGGILVYVAIITCDRQPSEFASGAIAQ